MAITDFMFICLAVLVTGATISLVHGLVCYLLNKYVRKDVWAGQPTFDILRIKRK